MDGLAFDALVWDGGIRLKGRVSGLGVSGVELESDCSHAVTSGPVRLWSERSAGWP